MNFRQIGKMKFPDLQITYRSKKCTPKEIGFLSIYEPNAQWQTQIESIKDAEAIILYNNKDLEIGYAIYKRSWSENGEIAGIQLYRCGFQQNADWNIRYGLLKHIFQSVEVPKQIINLPLANKEMVAIINKLGFTETIGQVSMEKSLQ